MFQIPIPPAETHWWKILIPTNPAEFWTFALFVATVGLGIVAYWGLNAISLSRTDIRNRTKRELAQTSIDRCGEMCHELIPLHGEILLALQAKKLDLFVSNASQVSFLADEETKKINGAIAWVQQLDRELIGKAVHLMNKLECWAMCFTHDPALADEKVAYDPCSNVYCQMVMTLYPALLTQRRINPSSGPYQNLVTLFKGWYSKKAQGQLLEQLNRAKSAEAKLPPLLGNELDE
jgi:hypothetical protein